MDFSTGYPLTASLRLEKELGAGAMGTVWTAHHQKLDTLVAVKVMAEGASRDKARARFEMEARASAKIASPHVISVFDYGIAENGLPYMVMELLDGEDLEHRLDREAPLPPKVALEIIGQACRGLESAHDAGFVHRDLKPANLFLIPGKRGDVHVKLLDFGVAKHLGDAGLALTATGSMMGTPYYMSPEQLLDPRKVDHRTDLWALAIVTYETLTACLPFDAETLGALSVVVNQGDFTPPSSLDPRLGTAIDAWFERALARDLDQRIETASEFALTLAEALDNPKRVVISTGVGAPTSEPVASGLEATHLGGSPVDATTAPPSTSLGPPALVAAATAELATADGKTTQPSAENRRTEELITSHSPSTKPQKTQNAHDEATKWKGIAAVTAIACGGYLGAQYLNRRPSPAVAADSSTSAMPTAVTEASNTPAAPSATSTSEPTTAPETDQSSSAKKDDGTAPNATAGTRRSPLPAGPNSVSDAEVIAAMQDCWRRNEGSRPDAKHAGVDVVLRPPDNGYSVLTRAGMGFRRCAEPRVAAFNKRRGHKAKSIRISTILKGKGERVAPTNAEVRAVVHSCWATYQTRHPGSPPATVSVQFGRGSFSWSGKVSDQKLMGNCTKRGVAPIRDRMLMGEFIKLTVSLPSNAPQPSPQPTSQQQPIPNAAPTTSGLPSSAGGD